MLCRSSSSAGGYASVRSMRKRSTTTARASGHDGGAQWPLLQTAKCSRVPLSGYVLTFAFANLEHEAELKSSKVIYSIS